MKSRSPEKKKEVFILPPKSGIFVRSTAKKTSEKIHEVLQETNTSPSERQAQIQTYMEEKVVPILDAMMRAEKNNTFIPYSKLQHVLTQYIMQEILIKDSPISLSMLLQAFQEQLRKRYGGLKTEKKLFKRAVATVQGAFSHALVQSYFLEKTEGKFLVHPFTTEDISYYDATKGVDLLLLDMDMFEQSGGWTLPVYLVDVKTWSWKREQRLIYESFDESPERNDVSFLRKIKEDIRRDMIKYLEQYPSLLRLLQDRATMKHQKVELEAVFDVYRVVINTATSMSLFPQEDFQASLGLFYGKLDHLFSHTFRELVVKEKNLG